jgi:transglutaminase-like putative cysteine protease
MPYLKTIFILYALCFTLYSHADEFNPRTLLEQATEITTALFPDADTVLLNDITRVRYETDGTSFYDSDSAIKILTEKGKRDYQTLSLSFNISYGTNYFTRVERITSAGEIIPIQIEENSRLMVDPDQMNANIYNPNSKRLQLSVPGLQIGDIIRYAFTDITTKPLVPNSWSDYQVFESTMPICKATYQVDAPQELPLQKIQLKDTLEGTIQTHQRKDDDRIIYTWTLNDIPQFFPEPSMPDAYTQTQRLLVSTLDSWEELSRWYWELCLPRMECTTPALEAKTAELTLGKNRAQKINALFQFVSQDIRYMGITTEEEAPGYEPHDVAITFENRYGVCRDKAALLAAMLRLADVEAFPVIIMAGPKKDEEVPQPFFNHAVVAALDENGEYILMDPTDENTKDIFPAYLQNMSYLVARPEGDTLRTSAVIPASENLTRIKTTGALQDSGSLEATTHIFFDGVNDTIYRSYLARLTPEEQHRFFEGQLQASLPRAQLNTLEILPQPLRDTTYPLEVNMSYTAEALLTGSPAVRMLSPPRIGNGIGYANFILRDTALQTRRFPLYTKITAGIHEVIELELDDALGTPHLPETEAIHSDMLLWNHTYAQEENRLVLTNQMELRTVEFSPAEYQSLKKELEKIEYEARKKVLIFGETPKEDLPDIRLQERRDKFRLIDENTWEQHRYEKVDILTYAGKKEYAEIIINYNPAWEEVEITQADVILADGTRKQIRAEEINEMDAEWVASAPRYPAEKIIVANLPSVDVGTTLEYAYTIRAHNQPGFSMQHTLNAHYPIETQEIQVELPENLELAMRSTFAQPKEEIKNKIKYLSWHADAQPRVAREEALPAWHTFNPYLRLSTLNWESYASTLFTAIKKASQDQPETAAFARQIVATCRTDREAIDQLHTWVARNIRRAGPSITDLPLQAITPADQTLLDRYGNQSDRMILLATMLDAVDIPFEYLLSSNNSLITEEIEPYITLPSPSLFDQLVLKIGIEDLPIYLSGASQYAQIGTSYFDHQQALNLDQKCLETLTLAEQYQDQVLYHQHLNIDTDGTLRLEATNTLHGMRFELLHQFYDEMTPELRRRNQQNLLQLIAENAKAQKEVETQFDHYPGYISYEATAERYAVLDGEYLYVNIPQLFDDLFNFRATERTLPFSYDALTDETHRIHIELPKEYEPVYMPSSYLWHAPKACGSITIDVLYEPQSNRIEITASAQLKPTWFDAASFPDFVRTQQALAHPNRHMLLLKKRDKSAD